MTDSFRSDHPPPLLGEGARVVGLSRTSIDLCNPTDVD
jgi:hypothetical protein